MIKKILLICVFFCGVAFANASQEKFVKQLDDSFKKIMNESSTKADFYSKNPDSYYKLLDVELEKLFDFDLITKRIVGKHYKQMSADELTKFKDHFKHSLFNNFSSFLLNPENLSSFKDKTSYSVGKFVMSQSNPNKASQDIAIKYENKSYNLSLSLFNKNNLWKGENMILDNLNIGLNYRNQFYNLMEKHKNNVDDVINNWKNAEELRKVTEDELGVADE